MSTQTCVCLAVCVCVFACNVFSLSLYYLLTCRGGSSSSSKRSSSRQTRLNLPWAFFHAFAELFFVVCFLRHFLSFSLSPVRPFRFVRFLCGRALRRSLANWRRKAKLLLEMATLRCAALRLLSRNSRSLFLFFISQNTLSLAGYVRALLCLRLRLRSCGEIEGGVWGGGVNGRTCHALRAASCSCALPLA